MKNEDAVEDIAAPNKKIDDIFTTSGSTNTTKPALIESDRIGYTLC